jgi:hypothetical protein
VALIEYHKDGTPVFRNVRVSGVPLGARVNFDVRWDADGTFTVRPMGGTWKTVNTHLRNYKAKVEVSNATATFYPDRA